jgi:hypothetical protein
MTSNIQLSGLCINCINNHNCSYQANQTKPVVFCEEFSCTDSLKSEKKLARDIENNRYPIEPLPSGICCNCDNVETCGLQKSDEPVLNCEEYK